MSGAWTNVNSITNTVEPEDALYNLSSSNFRWKDIYSINTVSNTVTVANSGYLEIRPLAGLYANGSLGGNGSVLVSNGTGVYWGTANSIQTPSNTGLVTNGTGIHVLANNGITANLTGVYVLANNGLTVNTSGLFVLANNGIASNSTGTYVLANSGIVSNSSGVFTLANNGIISNTSGLFVQANNGLVVNSTGVFILANTNVTVNSSGLHVLSNNIITANSGLVSNSSGIFVNPSNGSIVVETSGISVNSAYIGTIPSNSAVYANSSITNTFTVGTASYFVSNGNLGIGNTTPTAKLHVTGTANISGSVVVGGTLSDSIGNVRDIPLNTQSTSYQIANTDAGKTITTTANVTVNGAVLYANFIVSIYNNSSANVTILPGTGATMYLAGTANTSNRTLAQRGICTVYCVASNTFVISGGGLT